MEKCAVSETPTEECAVAVKEAVRITAGLGEAVYVKTGPELRAAQETGEHGRAAEDDQEEAAAADDQPEGTAAEEVASRGSAAAAAATDQVTCGGNCLCQQRGGNILAYRGGTISWPTVGGQDPGLQRGDNIRPANSSGTYLEPEFLTKKFLRKCVIFGIF